jgi:hypothetical protein
MYFYSLNASATFGNKVGVTTGHCSNPDRNVRWLRAFFGGGLIDGASRDSMSPGRFVLRVAGRIQGRRDDPAFDEPTTEHWV